MSRAMPKVQMVIFFFILFFGVGLAMAYKLEQQRHASTTYLRHVAMAHLLQSGLKTNHLLQNSLAQLQQKLRRVQSPSRKRLQSLQAKRAYLALAAARTAVHGQGLVVTLNDSLALRPRGVNLDLYLVHDDDVLRVVNRLNMGGAEAISINGQRLTSISQIRCAGPTISINHVRTAVPIVISAIGPATAMQKSLNDSSIVPLLRRFGVRVQIKASKLIVVPAFHPYVRG